MRTSVSLAYSVRTWIDRVVRALPPELQTDARLVAAINDGRWEDAFAQVQDMEVAAFEAVRRFEGANPHLARLIDRYRPSSRNTVGQVYFGRSTRHHEDLAPDTISELSWFHEERLRLTDVFRDLHEVAVQARRLLDPPLDPPKDQDPERKDSRP